MKVTYKNGKFRCKPTFEERVIPREAGFRWDPVMKYWWTTEYSAAAKLKDYLDESAEKELAKVSIQNLPWIGPLKIPVGETLYPFQEDSCYFALSRDRSYLALDPGLGKTPCAAVIAATLNAKSPCVVVYICPPFLTRNTENEFKKWAAGLYTTRYTKGVIFSGVTIIPDSILTRADTFNAIHIAVKAAKSSGLVTLLFVDECFIEGTLVDTPSGKVKIENIKPGDRILNCTGFDTVVSVKKTFKQEAFLLETRGKKLICSSNHPIFTQRGWVPAYLIKETDEIIETKKALQILQTQTCQNESDSFLRRELCLEMALEKPPGVSKQKVFAKTKQEHIRSSYGATATLAFTENETAQPHEEKSDTRENVFHFTTNTPQAIGSRWQWAWTYRHGKNIVASLRKRLASTFCGKDQQSQKLSQSLQNRYSTPTTKNSNRVRRLFAFVFSSEKAGPKEKPRIKITRLDSEALQKLGYIKSPQGYCFYDLEIKNHPSFSVEGCLVHNCHRYKNDGALRTKMMFGSNKNKGIAGLFDRVVYLSGTPMPNRPIELFPVLNHSAPETINHLGKFQYALKYCAAYQNEWGWDFSGASNVKELINNVHGKFMIRHRKDALALPPKLEEMVVLHEKMPAKFFEISHKILNSLSTEDLMKGRIEMDLDRTGIALATYRKELGKIKVVPAADFITYVLEEFPEESILVFAIHTDVIGGLAEELKLYHPTVITGKTPMEDRHRIVTGFQTDKEKRVLIGNIQAMGVGLTLTKATRVIFVEFDWVPANNDQASDRAHRIGQTNSVLVQYLVHENSVDQAVIETVLRKKKVTEKI